MEDELALLVDVSIPKEMDSPPLILHPLISSGMPQVSSKLTEDGGNKENADATIDSIEIERSDESDRRHSLTLATPGVLHQRILRDVTQKANFSNTVSSPAIPMIEDEVFDFDFVLSPASSSIEHSKEEEDEEEVFFGPMGFTEKCVAQTVGPEVKPLSPLNACQIAELVKEAALVAYRLKTDGENSTHNDSVSPPKKRHSRSGTFTMDDSPLKLLSLPIIECDELSPSVEVAKKPGIPEKKNGNTVTKSSPGKKNGNMVTKSSPGKKNGNTVTKGNKETLLEQGRKLLTPNRSRRSGVGTPAKAKKSLQGMFKPKPAEKKPEIELMTEREISKPDLTSRTSNPVPTIKQALTSKVPNKKSGLSKPRLQSPKTHTALKVVDTSNVVPAASIGTKPSSLKRSLMVPKSYSKAPEPTTNVSTDTSANKPSNSNRRSIPGLRRSLTVKTDSSNKNMSTATNRRSLNATVNVSNSRSIPQASSSSDRDSKLRGPTSSNGTKLNRSYTISEPETSDIPGSKRPASKLSLLQPGQIKKKAIAVPSTSTKGPVKAIAIAAPSTSTKGPVKAIAIAAPSTSTKGPVKAIAIAAPSTSTKGPVKAIAPAGINSRTVERKPSVRSVSSSSSQDVSMSTPIKQQKNAQPKLLSSTFTATPSSSGNSSNFLSSTPASGSKRRSCLPTPNSSRTSSLGSIPPPSPLSYRSCSGSSYGSVSDTSYTKGGKSRKPSIGTYGCLDEINENSPSALMAACKISTTNA
ncbi:platelet binding protein GspB-like isoform X2 [Argopecten irradians]|uniref:platelet binding protein GspB-like isoform X2 n=1 Tax=Argopecten irradians TaxID=31199 RepID=UPI0037205B9F